MDFEQKEKTFKKEHDYHMENLKIAREYSKQLLFEMKELVRSIVLFGSNTNDTLRKDSDIDLMIVLDNVSVYVSSELREAYKIITKKLNADIGQEKVHLTTINLSDLWDMARKGDPVLINILRYGIPLFDRDLVEPLQYLLEIGRMKPTRESAQNYLARAETLLKETEKHLMEGILDLHYAAIDVTHAALMTQKVLPPSPKEMPELFKEHFKDSKLLEHTETLEELYRIAKEIEHKRYHEMRGSEFDRLKKKTEKLVKDLGEFTRKEIDKQDSFEF